METQDLLFAGLYRQMLVVCGPVSRWAAAARLIFVHPKFCQAKPFCFSPNIANLGDDPVMRMT
jgi:hypothetical protein